ncbi:sororin [Sebastes umbrosus]|uniref:sororin n=1 Tax=Sebastes umbrosus TaxID=72105 RepID=UPI00189DEA4A|nr:sororin [Sebastes umbrosus]
MMEETPQNIMSESNNVNGSQRRRSPRFSSPPPDTNDTKMASAAVKRSITVRKIAPRKTVAPSENNKENHQENNQENNKENNQENHKENTPRRSERSQQKLKVSTPSPVPGCGGSSSAKKKKKKAVILSPILPSPPPPAVVQRAELVSHQSPPAAADPEDAVWSQKVRRSYSRLSDKSFDSRDTMFGFEKLQTPEVFRRVERSKTGLEVSCASLLSGGLNSFTSLLEAEDNGSAAFPEPDLNIPGVVMVKEKRKRMKKVQQIGTTELNELAAQMNAEFEEAEEFELLVE